MYRHGASVSREPAISPLLSSPLLPAGGRWGPPMPSHLSIVCTYIHTCIPVVYIPSSVTTRSQRQPGRARACVRGHTCIGRLAYAVLTWVLYVCMYVCMCSWFLPSFLAGVRRCVLCGHVCGHMYVCCMYGWMEVGCPLVCRYVCT